MYYRFAEPTELPTKTTTTELNLSQFSCCSHPCEYIWLERYKHFKNHISNKMYADCWKVHLLLYSQWNTLGISTNTESCATPNSNNWYNYNEKKWKKGRLLNPIWIHGTFPATFFIQRNSDRAKRNFLPLEVNSSPKIAVSVLCFIYPPSQKYPYSPITNIFFCITRGG